MIFNYVFIPAGQTKHMVLPSLLQQEESFASPATVTHTEKIQ